MKPSAKKTILSTAILTVAFCLAWTTGSVPGNGDSPKRIIASAVVMGLGLIAAVLVWASGPAGSDDGHGEF